jgi:nicotinamide mononucleotide transporter
MDRVSWLASLIAPLNHVVFDLGNDAVSYAEILGFATGAACVWLTVRSRISNFPVGIANSAFFLVLFLAARLYADAGLQVVYIALGFIGWWQWRYGGAARSARRIERARTSNLVVCLLFVAVATWGLTALLRAVDDAAPFWDALTTALSLAAQYLLNVKKIETWFFWIAADIVYIPLYATKRLDLTAIVYVLFLLMCLRGLVEWRRVRRANANINTASTVPLGSGAVA